jgi:hypothetical protein
LSDILTVADVAPGVLAKLLHGFGLELVVHGPGERIAGSYWGEPEAGLLGSSVHVRPDTPVHSLLHELSHLICMDERRRAGLDTDAGGDDLEEAAACYLQVLLADDVAGVGRERIMTDMDAWGYSFRLGNTRAWFEHDADDAREFLLEHELIDPAGEPTLRLRRQ